MNNLIRLAFRSLTRQKRPTLLFVVALISIITVSTFLYSSLRTVNVSIEDDITQYGRGTYDLLVRPANNQSEVEQEIGLVEENYLSVGKGGISLTTWEEIKEMESVEMAAPVAALGYFTGESKSITLPFPTSPQLYDIKFSTSDGVNTFPINRSGITVISPMEPPQDSMDNILFDSIGDWEIIENFNQYWYEGITVMLPETYHLLVGIDPTEEEQLTGISFAQLHNPIFDKLHYSFAGDAPIIHLLQLEDANVSMELDIKVLPLDDNIFKEMKGELDLPKGTMFFEIFGSEQYDQALQMVKQLVRTNNENVDSYHYDLTKLLIPFESDPFHLNDQFQLSTNPDYFTSNIGNTANYFVASGVNYEIEDDNHLTSYITGEHEQIPIYRTLKQEGGTFHDLRELPFVLNIAGAYSIKEKEESIASSPLGLYYLSDMYTTEEEQVIPTSTPGSFVAAPAHGVIDIKDAEIIKGENPIDAIRVKVAGITSYDQAAIRKIEDLAVELNHLGLHVDIIAGASDQLIPVTVEKVGIVEQPWTTLGAAALIKEQWNLTSFILSGLFFFVALFYIANRLMFWKAQKQKEIELYGLLGWDKKEQRKLLSTELNVLFGFSFLVASVILVGVEQLSEVGSNIYLNHFLVSILLYILIILLRHRKGKIDIKNKPKNNINTSMLIRNFRYYQSYMKLNSVQLFMTSLMSVFVAAIIWITYNKSGVTKLGEFINENLLVLLLLLLLVSFGLALLTVTETITNFLSVRRYELKTLILIGWDRRDIWLLNAKEISVWSFPSMFIGFVIGTLIAIFYFSFTWTLIWFGVGIFAVFSLLTALFMAWMISRELSYLYK